MKLIKNIIAALSLLLVFSYTVQAENELKNHPSPYLAMHGKDPVNWQRWDNSIFERAKKENKLVFVSIGYFACHWCHVMQRESYRNPEIAKIMNKEFISVKVDRELRPALDARLIQFVEKTRGYAGWPLNVFITPDGYPLIGIVYLPPADFKSLLLNVAETWKTDPDGMNVIAEAAAEVMQKIEPSQGSSLNKKDVNYYQDLYKDLALQNADYLQGGFGEQSKFPLAPQLSLLLQLYEKNQDKSLGEFLQLTFDSMSSLGLYDQLRGGFFRYVVDPNWQIPHFEKMLYDNTQLVSLYLRAGAVFKNKRYVQTAMESMDFLINEFTDETGGMISSFSAIDSNNVEGGYYLWSNDELEKTLTSQEYKVIKLYWGIKHAPELSAGYHLRIDETISNISVKSGISNKEVVQVIQSAKSKLKKQQLNRKLPKDDKVLAAWNGLALSALVKAAEHNKKYELEAKKIQSLLLTKFWDGQSLKRAQAKGVFLGNATLEDYAYVSDGLMDWVIYSKNKKLLQPVREIIDQAWKRFYSDDGWLLAEGMIPGISAREAIIADGPMPSPSAILIKASIKLANLLKDKQLSRKAISALNRGHKILKTDSFWYATHIGVMSEVIE
ncbi:MAG: thioredoxin domain-containing protein [Gammaproteobacteria bacterium]|nr:thioredoxin domain-containing protein [Gammaproteobacteria bacterium]